MVELVYVCGHTENDLNCMSHVELIEICEL